MNVREKFSETGLFETINTIHPLKYMTIINNCDNSRGCGCGCMIMTLILLSLFLIPTGGGVILGIILLIFIL